jgi:hypothetical protein
MKTPISPHQALGPLQKLGDAIAKAVADAEKNSDNSDCLTAIKQKSFHSQKMEVF